MKRNHPGLQSTVVGIHVLDVEDSINPALLARIDRSMSNALCPGKVDIDTSIGGTKNRVRVDQGAQPFPYVTCIAHKKPRQSELERGFLFPSAGTLLVRDFYLVQNIKLSA